MSSAPCGPRQVAGPHGCECPSKDVLCPTRGYAHFVISNVAGSGLPNEVSYEIREQTILDRVTGLIWERDAPDPALGWPDAKARCEALDLDGRTDFRLPGRIELITLLDFNELPVAANVFENVVADYHWTSSPAAFALGSAFTVYFGAGEVTVARANPGSARARCVAGDVRGVTPSPFVLDGELVFDQASSLTWQRTENSPMSFAASATACAALGMRLPSLRELASIVDETRSNPALDLDVFEHPNNQPLWTSTLRGTEPWVVNFEYGKTFADVLSTDSLASRCVR